MLTTSIQFDGTTRREKKTMSQRDPAKQLPPANSNGKKGEKGKKGKENPRQGPQSHCSPRN